MHEAIQRFDGRGRAHVVEEGQHHRSQHVTQGEGWACTVFGDAQGWLGGAALSIDSSHHKGRHVSSRTNLHLVSVAKATPDEQALAFDVGSCPVLVQDVAQQHNGSGEGRSHLVALLAVPCDGKSVQACSLFRPRRSEHPSEQPRPKPRIARDLDRQNIPSSREASDPERQASLVTAQRLWKRPLLHFLGGVPCGHPGLRSSFSKPLRPLTNELIQGFPLRPSCCTPLPSQRRAVIKIGDPQ